MENFINNDLDLRSSDNEYLSTFWRTLKMPLINCEINLILTWSSTWVITNSTGVGKFEIAETKSLCPSCNFINQR